MSSKGKLSRERKRLRAVESLQDRLRGRAYVHYMEMSGEAVVRGVGEHRRKYAKFFPLSGKWQADGGFQCGVSMDSFLRWFEDV